MPIQKISGQSIAKKWLSDLARTIQHEITLIATPPKIAIIQPNDDPSSLVYIQKKQQVAKDLGIETEVYRIDTSSSDQGLARIHTLLQTLAQDDSVHGIIIQKPFPSEIIPWDIIRYIPLEKDIDGFHPFHLGSLSYLGQNTQSLIFIPCTPLGIIKLLQASDIPIQGSHIAIIGRSHLVGTPLAYLLSAKWKYGNATVTLCHSQTQDLKNIIEKASTIILATGKKEFFDMHTLPSGTHIIDVGIHVLSTHPESNKRTLVGDVHFDSVAPVAKSITPVPGGVGPMTIAALMHNIVQSWIFHTQNRVWFDL